MSYTRGPWRIQDGILAKDNGNNSLTAIGDMRSFLKDDARLIAAAPEMLEMLTSIYHILEGYGGTLFENEGPRIKKLLDRVKGE